MLDKNKSIEVFDRVIECNERRFLEEPEFEAFNHTLYGLSFDTSDNIESCVVVMSGINVYSVIDDAISRTSCKQEWDYMALYTEGWAAPSNPAGYDSDVPPSQHPLKKRVKIVCIVGRDNSEHVESVMLLEGNSQPQYELGGKGQLAESLLSIYSKKKNENTNIKQFYI